MALEDINFSEGEGQDFLVELPSAAHAGSLGDILCEGDSAQYMVNEIPEVQGGGDGDIFIIGE